MFNRRQLVVIILRNLLKAGIAMAVAAVIAAVMRGQILKIGDSLYENRKLTLILERQTDTVSKLKGDVSAVGPYIPRLEAAFPPDDNILEFVGALETLANQHSLQQTVRFGVPSATQGTGERIETASIDYSIALNGTLTTLVNYLKSFETLPFFTGITTITVNAGSPQGWEANSSISIQAKLYAKHIGL